VVTPTAGTAPVARRSKAKTHIGYSGDAATHEATISRILRRASVQRPVSRSAMLTHEQEEREKAAAASA
jgi:hypothetical protein